MFARACMRESQEMVFDAHDRAFAFFRGTCTRGIYDNMKTAVEAVFTGKERQYNRRFLQMCSHYLVQPVACTPASGWENGQVENRRPPPHAPLDGIKPIWGYHWGYLMKLLNDYCFLTYAWISDVCPPLPPLNSSRAMN